jgi:hypothetical protein
MGLWGATSSSLAPQLVDLSARAALSGNDPNSAARWMVNQLDDQGWASLV